MFPESLTLTPLQVSRMRVLRSRGLLIGEISEVTGVPRSTVHTYVRDLPLRRGVIDESVLWDLLDEGYKHEEIALRLGVTRQAVSTRLYRARGRRRGRGREMTPAQVRRAVRMRSDGLSYAEVARVLGFSKPALHRRLKREDGIDDGPKD